MRLAFFGTPDFAVPALAALVASGHEIAGAWSRPPRPAGRGRRARPTAVARAAAARGIPVHAPETLTGADMQAAFAALRPDAAVVVAYGLLLPPPVLAAPRLGCLNIHASLLPRWRGAAPIQRALLAGDGETGVTIMLMDAGLDTGPVLLRAAVPIGPQATAADLHDQLATLGARLAVTALAGLEHGSLQAVPQPESGVTHARRLGREEAPLDWTRPAADLARQVRALVPWPGARCVLAGRTVKVLAAEVAAGTGPPGRVLEDLTVACGAGALRLLRVQRPGRRALDAAAFLRGTPVAPGTVLG